MEVQIDKIKRDIAIHKEVEKELAKRSHFCQKVIKKLTENAETLEAHKATLPVNLQQDEPEDTLRKKDNPDEEMINFLEGKLEQIER